MTIDTSPLTHDLNNGYSWGLEHPVIYGWRPDRDAWMAWDRHTGEVKHALPANPNVHGWDRGKYQIQKLSMPAGYNDTFIDFDAIP